MYRMKDNPVHLSFHLWAQLRIRSKAVAQRARDAQFHSVFIVGNDVKAQTFQDLKGLNFTFGSESSTSGHLMPRYYLLEAGVDPDEDFFADPHGRRQRGRAVDTSQWLRLKPRLIQYFIWKFAMGGETFKEWSNSLWRNVSDFFWLL